MWGGGPGTIMPGGGGPLGPKGKGEPDVGTNGGPDEPGRLGDCPLSDGGPGPQFDGEFGTHGPQDGPPIPLKWLVGGPGGPG